MHMQGELVAGYRGKRSLDVVLLVAVAPPAIIVGILTALVVRIAEGSPVLYRQERVGLHGKRFHILKFRTMVAGADRTPFPEANLITPTGRMLRRTSLDEVPQLWNIARGEMSWVGPRPTLAYQVQRYDDVQRGRLSLRPGITGLAQVRGRNGMPWADRIKLDVEYVLTSSLRTDLKILMATARVVLSGSGSEGHPVDDPLAAAESS